MDIAVSSTGQAGNMAWDLPTNNLNLPIGTAQYTFIIRMQKLKKCMILTHFLLDFLK